MIGGDGGDGFWLVHGMPGMNTALLLPLLLPSPRPSPPMIAARAGLGLEGCPARSATHDTNPMPAHDMRADLGPVDHPISSPVAQPVSWGGGGEMCKGEQDGGALEEDVEEDVWVVCRWGLGLGVGVCSQVGGSAPGLQDARYNIAGSQ